MRYKETKDHSAELLRLILPLMSAHEAAFHPTSYTVWYEYVSGANAELTEALDRMTEDNAVLGEKQIQQLYRTFIADRDEAKAERVQSELQRLMKELSDQANSTGQQAERYSKELDAATGALEQGVDESNLSRIVDDLIHGTRDIKGSVHSLQGTLSEGVREVEVLKYALKQAIGEALTDPLTQLKNRRAFDRQLSSMLAEFAEGKQEHSLLLLDVDKFKAINDKYGHVFGDKVLRSIAHVLQKMVKGRDIVARYGGEEFAILLPETAISGARILAEKIREAIAKGRIRNLENSSDIGNITISIGVASCKVGELPEDLVARADEALYASKHNGRNRVTVAATERSAAA